MTTETMKISHFLDVYHHGM